MHAAADVSQQGLAEGISGVHRHIIGVQVAAGRLNHFDELADPFQISGAHRVRVDSQVGRDLLEVAKLLVTGKRETQLLLGHQVENYQFVLAEIKVVQRFDDARRIIKQVADEKHHAAPRNPLGHIVQHRRRIRIRPGLAAIEHLEDPPEEMAPQWLGVDPNLPYKRLLLAMLYELGLRLMDNLRIEWPQIDLGAGTLTVRIAKTDQVATLQLSSTLVVMLANLPDEAKTGRLFPWWSSRGVYAWLDRVKKRAKVHYTPHLSRHAMATAAGLMRIPDGEAAKLGAWSDPRSLHRYQHVAPEPIPGRHAGRVLNAGAVDKTDGISLDVAKMEIGRGKKRRASSKG